MFVWTFLSHLFHGLASLGSLFQSIGRCSCSQMKEWSLKVFGLPLVVWRGPCVSTPGEWLDSRRPWGVVVEMLYSKTCAFWIHLNYINTALFSVNYECGTFIIIVSRADPENLEGVLGYPIVRPIYAFWKNIPKFLKVYYRRGSPDPLDPPWVHPWSMRDYWWPHFYLHLSGELILGFKFFGPCKVA